MRQTPRSPEEDALNAVEKAIKTLPPDKIPAFKASIDTIFAQVRFDQPKTAEQVAMETKIVDLFSDPHADPVTKAAHTRARFVLQKFFNPKIHAHLRDHNFEFQPDPQLAVGDILSFKLIKQRKSFWYSQHRDNGKSQGIDNLSDKTLELIQEKLRTIGAELEVVEDRKFKPSFYWK